MYGCQVDIFFVHTFMGYSPIKEKNVTEVFAKNKKLNKTKIRSALRTSCFSIISFLSNLVARMETTKHSKLKYLVQIIKHGN